MGVKKGKSNIMLVPRKRLKIKRIKCSLSYDSDALLKSQEVSRTAGQSIKHTG